ncbi:hypothetical protein [Effusibacillus dendaii]|uniref:Uncharacterized protein n=1 Tax=Effusibacillus dendaii TaxID=2743772 RepID=A0A7I8DAS6_9BACL|nr:hypothetical protein [Effusibacillus dendaii]BCJ86452.1 hypothetical protein skT53_14370 [Effusibacillus dendaii]
MAVLNVQDITASGITPSYTAAAAAGDSFANDGQTMLHVKNGDTAAHTVTIKSARQCNQGFTHDLTVSVAAGSDKMIGPFSRDRFNDDNGRVQITYDAVTGMTVAVLQL